MISFSCSRCGMKLTVKAEFAGRSSRCPTCKQPLVVPQPSLAPPIAEGAIDGTSSSLIQIGVDAGVTLNRDSSASATALNSIREILARRGKSGERYIIAQEIGRGGMGTILRAVDCDVRREVAIKYLLDQTDMRKKLRFIEEAQITGQLEHPNIVPIHELGTDSQKRLFFSMKMVRGRSLAQVLKELRKNVKSAEKEYSLARLLNILVSICNAVAYAHSRGVIHRDLKPSNVMLGDFGEVYVMDWGLARVLGAGAAAGPQVPLPNAPAATVRLSKVETNRNGEADLTQEGAILGTPSYMPPEQAAGHIDAIDQRSDLYSLGAILYEILTLLPPVTKEGSYLEVMMRVVAGEIAPPEQRSPERARAGKIPKELAAVAMKALARQPHDRYANVEALRRDIERFQEGRSVSARRYKLRELAWMVVKRNRAVTLVVAVAMVLLASLWARSSWISYREQKMRREQAVPAFIEAAHFAVEHKKFDNALVQVSTAVEYDPERADALLLKSQLLIVCGKYSAARTELERYLKLKPADAMAAELMALCTRGRPGDATSVAAMADVFRRQNEVALAASMFQSREDLLPLYRRQIDAAWPGAGANLEMDQSGLCTFGIPPAVRAKVEDLSVLRGIPLTVLNLSGCTRIKDLSPLRNLPLTALYLEGCSEIKDLTPLQGLKLTALSLNGDRQIRDLAPLQTMPLINLNLAGCDQLRDLAALQGLRLAALNIWNCSLITDLAPLKGMPLVSLSMGFCGQIKDLSVLPTLASLRALDLTGCGQIRDLSWLRGMKLTTLSLSSNGQIRDLGPLRNMQLTQLRLSNCQQIQDLSPLKGMPLTVLDLQSDRQIRDLAPLAGMKLTTLDLSGCIQVHDLTPLQGMSLVMVYLNPKTINRGLEVLRSMQSLRGIGIGPGMTDRFSPVLFWKKYDAGDFK